MRISGDAVLNILVFAFGSLRSSLIFCRHSLPCRISLFVTRRACGSGANCTRDPPFSGGVPVKAPNTDADRRAEAVIENDHHVDIGAKPWQLSSGWHIGYRWEGRIGWAGCQEARCAGLGC